MSVEDDIKSLTKLALFQVFTHDQLRLLSFGAEHHSYAANQTIFLEGTPADCAFLVLSGHIDLYHNHHQQSVLVQTVGRGDLLGEMALFSKTLRPVTAHTTTTSELLRISHESFHRVLEEYPQTTEALLNYISQNLRTLVSDLERASQ